MKKKFKNKKNEIKYREEQKREVIKNSKKKGLSSEHHVNLELLIYRNQINNVDSS